LADGAQVLAGITRNPSVGYPCLVPNAKGMESALKCKVDEIAVFGAASEAFTQKNIRCTIEESLNRFETVMSIA
jgi:hydroxymethylglutaryl-CoA lyase